jgi:hypothetical protein
MAVPKWRDIERNLDNIKKWAEDGVKENLIYKRLGISKTTWFKYKRERGILNIILTEAKIKRNEAIVPEMINIILNDARGYTLKNAEVVEIVRNEEDEKPVIVQIKKTTKKMPPNADSAFKILKQFTKDAKKKKERWVDNPAEYSLKEQRLKMEKEALRLKKQMSDFD